MKEKTLPVLSEPGYTSSVWFIKSIAGLRDAAAARRIAVSLLSDAQELERIPTPGALVLAASDSEWTGFMLARLRERGVKVVLMGAAPNDFGPDVGGALINRDALVRDMVRYFYQAGRTRLASLGYEANLANDGIRRHAFLSAARAYRLDVDERRDVYDLGGSLEDCLSRFFDNVSLYDGVLCTNDYVACELLVQVARRGVRVPEQLFVAGSGNLTIGSCIKPTLTTSTLDYYEMGVQTFNLWNLTETETGVVSAGITIPYRIIPRGSTAFAQVPDGPEAAPPAPPPQAASCDPRLLWLRRLENCLLQCDATDHALLAGVLREQSTEELAAALFISPGTVQYRLKKLYAAVGAQSRAQFARLIGPYVASLEPMGGDGPRKS
jgi:DNA-binding LacI/PurR family transcriptional regulator